MCCKCSADDYVQKCRLIISCLMETPDDTVLNVSIMTCG